MNRFVSSSVLDENQNEINNNKLATTDEAAKKDELPYDPRPLWEKLQEKKLKAEEEFAEKMRFSNHIKRLDDDEIEFLSSTALEQRTKQIEEAKVVREELEAFREACKVAHAPTAPTSASSITSSISVSNELTSSTAATASRQSLVKDDVQRSILGSGLLIVKKRKLSASATRGGGEGVVGGGAESSSTPSNTEKNSPPGKSPVAKGLASLVSGYGSSDEDSD